MSIGIVIVLAAMVALLAVLLVAAAAPCKSSLASPGVGLQNKGESAESPLNR